MDPAKLDAIPLFAGLAADDRAEIAAAMRQVTVQPGEALATEGAFAYELFVIEGGEAEVRKGGEVVRSLGPGDVVGEIGLLATGTRTATVVATTPMTLLAMFSRELRQIERRQPAIAERLRETMRTRVARTSF